GFEGAVGIAEIDDADLVEIVAACIYRQITTPVIGTAPVAYLRARAHLIHDIGAASRGHFHRTLLEAPIIIAMFRKDRHEAEDQRQLAILAIGQDEADTMGVRLLNALDFPVIDPQVRPAMITL